MTVRRLVPALLGGLATASVAAWFLWLSAVRTDLPLDTATNPLTCGPRLGPPLAPTTFTGQKPSPGDSRNLDALVRLNREELKSGANVTELIAHLVSADGAAAQLAEATLDETFARAYSSTEDPFARALIAAVWSKHSPRAAIGRVQQAPAELATVQMAAVSLLARSPSPSRTPRDADYWTGLILDVSLADLFRPHFASLSTAPGPYGGARAETRGRAYAESLRPLSEPWEVAAVDRLITSTGKPLARMQAVHLMAPDAPEVKTHWARYARDSRLPDDVRAAALARLGSTYPAAAEPIALDAIRAAPASALATTAASHLAKWEGVNGRYRGDQEWMELLRILAQADNAAAVGLLVVHLPTERLRAAHGALVEIALTGTSARLRRSATGGVMRVASGDHADKEFWSAMIDALGEPPYLTEAHRALVAHLRPLAPDDLASRWPQNQSGR